MKKIIFISFFLLFKIEIQAQYVIDNYPWCPQGATWIYKSFSATSTLYFKFAYEKDTVINTLNSKKINVSRIEYVGIQPGEGRLSNKVGQEFLLEKSDSIFWFDTSTNNFKFIYSFNPLSGDKFIIENSRALCTGNGSFPTSDTIIVNNITVDTFSNRIFNVVNTSMNDNFQIGNIVSKIGSLKFPFPQINRTNCLTSQAEYGTFYEGLVCYQDNLRGSVQFSSKSSSECYSISTSLEQIKPNALSNYYLFPNPVSSTLNIEGGTYSPKSITIYNYIGQIVKYAEISSSSIPVDNLLSGSYVIKIVDERDNVFIHKLIKY
jgi:hypothetical protein